MATLGSTALTYADWAKRMDDDYRVAMIIELLSQTNEILDDMLWTEGNLPTGHKTIQVVGLPSVYYRLVNAGVPRGRASTVAITEGTAMIEAYSLVDKDLAAFSGDPAKFRLIEDMSFVQSMNITMAQALFYGNALTAPEQFNGLAPRYSTVNQATTPSAANVIDAGPAHWPGTAVPGAAGNVEKALAGLAHLGAGATPFSPVGLRIDVRGDGRGPRGRGDYGECDAGLHVLFPR